MKSSTLPNISDAGHVLIVSLFPPSVGGSSIVMKNLLSYFNLQSYSVATIPLANHFAAVEGVKVYNLMPSLHLMRDVDFFKKLNRRFQDWYLPRAIPTLVKLIEKLDPVAIVGVYPSYQVLHLVREACKITQRPWIAYLHDTMSEMARDTYLKEMTEELEVQTFEESSRILMMSEGMVDWYKPRYELKTISLEHSYIDPIPTELPTHAVERKAFWGGSIYRINTNAVKRVAAGLKLANTGWFLTTYLPQDILQSLGLLEEHLEFRFFPDYGDYFTALHRHEILVLALDYTDECAVHFGELATIFPTKTPEYLATGRAILVHCPEDYFLAKFFREHQCGLVVSERSPEKIAEAVRLLQSDSEEVVQMRRNALKTAQLFAIERVAGIFQSEVNKCIGLKWGEQV